MAGNYIIELRKLTSSDTQTVDGPRSAGLDEIRSIIAANELQLVHYTEHDFSGPGQPVFERMDVGGKLRLYITNPDGRRVHPKQLSMMRTAFNARVAGRVDDLKARYPGFEDWVDYLAGRDPAGNQKYLMWAVARALEQAPQGPAPVEGTVERFLDSIAETVKFFHEAARRHRLDNADLYSYPTIEAARAAVADARTTRTDVKKEGATLIAQGHGYSLYQVLNGEASQQYGANTRWCISGNDADYHFDNYSNYHDIYMLVGGPQKFAVLTGRDNRQVSSIFNAVDENIVTALDSAVHEGLNEALTLCAEAGFDVTNEPVKVEFFFVVNTSDQLGWRDRVRIYETSEEAVDALVDDYVDDEYASEFAVHRVWADLGTWRAATATPGREDLLREYYDGYQDDETVAMHSWNHRSNSEWQHEEVERFSLGGADDELAYTAQVSGGDGVLTGFDLFDLDEEVDPNAPVPDPELKVGDQFRVDGKGPVWTVVRAYGAGGCVQNTRHKRKWFGYSHDRDGHKVYIYPMAQGSGDRTGADIAVGAVVHVDARTAGRRTAFDARDAWVSPDGRWHELGRERAHASWAVEYFEEVTGERLDLFVAGERLLAEGWARVSWPDSVATASDFALAERVANQLISRARVPFVFVEVTSDPGMYEFNRNEGLVRVAAINVVDEAPESHDDLYWDTKQPGRLDTQDTAFPTVTDNDDADGADSWAPRRKFEGSVGANGALAAHAAALWATRIWQPSRAVMKALQDPAQATHKILYGLFKPSDALQGRAKTATQVIMFALNVSTDSRADYKEYFTQMALDYAGSAGMSRPLASALLRLAPEHSSPAELLRAAEASLTGQLSVSTSQGGELGVTTDNGALSVTDGVHLVGATFHVSAQYIGAGTLDQLSGGLADNLTPDDFDPDALIRGTNVELEHVDDQLIAREIAMDHLTEDPQYYDKLHEMERDAEVGHSLVDLTERGDASSHAGGPDSTMDPYAGDTRGSENQFEDHDLKLGVRLIAIEVEAADQLTCERDDDYTMGHDGVSLIDTEDNPNDWTNPTEHRRDLSVDPYRGSDQ